ncbi:MAG: HAD family hydrolase, partial [Anaerolineales bacterium]|nr:HAD family hydrolase [Anaerolineales bacterium]
MPGINGINTVLFDLDGTLRHNQPDATHSFFSKAIELGLPESPDGWHEAARWAFAYWANSKDLKRDQESYLDDEAAFWQNYAFKQLLAYGATQEQAQAISPDIFTYMSEEFRPEDVVPDEVPETLASLKEAGFTLAVVSNRDNPFEEYLDEVGLLGYFEFSLAAGEVNSWKPDPEIFHQALSKADAAPGQAVYVGDNYYADVLGARQAGIRPILLDPTGIFADFDCDVIPSLDR